MSITIDTSNLRGKPAPLYHVYPRQEKPQPAYSAHTQEATMYNYYTLLDRYYRGDQYVIRAQHARSGACVDIYVRDEDASLAAELWGGSKVPCVRRDGTLWYDRGDLITDDEEDDLDRILYLREARELAGPRPSDEELLDIRERRMSHNQRRAALRALRER